MIIRPHPSSPLPQQVSNFRFGCYGELDKDCGKLQQRIRIVKRSFTFLSDRGTYIASAFLCSINHTPSRTIPLGLYPIPHNRNQNDEAQMLFMPLKALRVLVLVDPAYLSPLLFKSASYSLPEVLRSP